MEWVVLLFSFLFAVVFALAVRRYDNDIERDFHRRQHTEYGVDRQYGSAATNVSAKGMEKKP
ncbi:MAG: hypothetical protein AB8F65_14780 [Woeseiaceae bacterium]